MRKIFTSLLLFSALAVPALATDYTGTLTVTVNGTSADPSETTISVDKNEGGTYCLQLKNFILSMGGDVIPVGNIKLDNVAATTSGDAVILQTSQQIAITAGDDSNVSEWMGPSISAAAPIPVDMKGVIQDNKFRTFIFIDFSALEMKINVEFNNSGFQIPNSDFEDFHEATNGNNKSDEPNNWHSFMSSVTGVFTGTVKSQIFTYKSDIVRPGTTGTSSVKVVSNVIVGQSANGTITTGRLQATAISASSTDNCSYLDMSKTDKDANGDPFYTELTGHPDSIKVWAKYKRGTISDKNKNNVYATMSAAITDGAYYQDPTNKTYTNIVATAKNDKIESKDFSWQEISVPFDYASYSSYNIEPKAILVTISTNTVAAGGSIDRSNPDELYIDDLSLVYNSKLAALTVDGTAVEGFDKETKTYSLTTTKDLSAEDIVAVADGQGAYVSTTVETTEGGQVATITVTAEDLSATNTYTLNITKSGTGIKEINGASDAAPTAVYTIDGKRVKNTSQKGLYIVRKADGTAIKVLQK